MQNAECRIKENARAFWIVKLRKRLISNRKTVFSPAKLYKIKSEGLPKLLTANC